MGAGTHGTRRSAPDPAMVLLMAADFSQVAANRIQISGPVAPSRMDESRWMDEMMDGSPTTPIGSATAEPALARKSAAALKDRRNEIMPKRSAVLMTGLVLSTALLAGPAASVEDVAGIEVSVRARSQEEGRALAVRAAGDEAARRLGLDRSTTVVSRSTFRDERFDDGRLEAVLDVAVDGRRASAVETRAAPERQAGASGSSWILVVHAVRNPAGRLVPWDRGDPWGSIWRVPTALKGFRAVPVTGDAEDVAQVTGQALDAFDGRAFRHLAAKYRAPAVALVVREGGEAAIVAWRNGFTTEWSRMPIGNLSDAAGTRIAVSKALASLVGSGIRDAAPVAEAEEGRSTRGPDTIRISDWRVGPSGGQEYRAVLSAGDADDAIGRLSAEGIEVLSMREGPSGAEVILSSPDGGPIESGLRRAGLRVSR